MPGLSELKTRVAQTPSLKTPSKPVRTTYSVGENKKKDTSNAGKASNLNRANQVCDMEQYSHKAAIAEGTACVNPSFIEVTSDNFSSHTLLELGTKQSPQNYDEYQMRAHGLAYTTESNGTDGKYTYTNTQVAGSSTKAHHEQAAEHYVNSLHNLSLPNPEAQKAYHLHLTEAQKAKIGDAYLNGSEKQREAIEHELAILHSALEKKRTNPSSDTQKNVTDALRRLDTLSGNTFSVKSASTEYVNIQEVEQKITNLKAKTNKTDAEKKELAGLEAIAKVAREHQVELKGACEIMSKMREEDVNSVALLELIQGTKCCSEDKGNMIDGLKEWFTNKWNGKDRNATWWDKTQAIGAGIAGVIGLLWLFNFITGKMSGGGQANANGQETYTKEQVIEILKRFYAQVQQTQSPTASKVPMQRALPVGGQFSGVG
jgi:hypothetical protein